MCAVSSIANATKLKNLFTRFLTYPYRSKLDTNSPSQKLNSICIYIESASRKEHTVLPLERPVGQCCIGKQWRFTVILIWSTYCAWYQGSTEKLMRSALFLDFAPCRVVIPCTSSHFFCTQWKLEPRAKCTETHTHTHQKIKYPSTVNWCSLLK